MKTQSCSRGEQIAALGDNARYHKSNRDRERRRVGKAAALGSISSVQTVVPGSLYAQVAV